MIHAAGRRRKINVHIVIYGEKGGNELGNELGETAKTRTAV
jgi:hypothetical protein